MVCLRKLLRTVPLTLRSRLLMAIHRPGRRVVLPKVGVGARWHPAILAPQGLGTLPKVRVGARVRVRRSDYLPLISLSLIVLKCLQIRIFLQIYLRCFLLKCLYRMMIGTFD